MILNRILKIAVFLAVLLQTGLISAQSNENDTRLSAESIIYEENSTGAILTLSGPVEIILGPDKITADTAIVDVNPSSTSLEKAIRTIQLKGNVKYSGGGGAMGEASDAVYRVAIMELTLNGGSFSHGDLKVSAPLAVYNKKKETVTLSGGCKISDNRLSASADSAVYTLVDHNGSMSGNVVITYPKKMKLFGEYEINEVILKSDSLVASEQTGVIKTGGNGEKSRTTMTAGEFLLVADSITFTGSQNQLSEVEAIGNVTVTGPQMNLTAGAMKLSETDRILKASQNVTFSIRGQSGTADTISVNFASGWAIKLSGATIQGTADEEISIAR